MSLKDQMLTDMATTFLNDSDFAESVTYKNLNGQTRAIKAIVIRDPISLDPSVPRPKYRVTVANDSTIGISSVELDVGGDQLAVAPNLGATPVYYNIRGSASLSGEDPGAMKLELE